MNNYLKYSSIFIFFTVLLLFASSLVAAADINDTASTDISENIITNTVSDDSISSSQNDNNIESQTIQKEVDTTNNDKTNNTTTTSESKELIKNDKNLKGKDISNSMTLTPNMVYAGETVTATLNGGTFFSRASSFNVYLDGVSIKSGSMTPRTGKTTSVTFDVPESTSSGDHTIRVTVTYSMWNNIGTNTLTVLSKSVDTKISEIDAVNGKIGSTSIPVTVTDMEGNAIAGEQTLTFKDGDTVLLDNVTISDGVATVNVPTSRIGEYPITVIYNGAVNAYNPSNTTVNVIVSKADSEIIIEDNDDEFYNAINALYNTVLTGTLQTTDKVAIANNDIIITINGTDYTVTTDADGKFKYTYDVTQIAEEIPISVKFNGNELYNPADEISGFFDIEPITLTISLDDVELSEVNETTTISGNVIDEFNHIVADTPINLTITGVDNPITLTTDSEGKFTYDIEFKEAQNITVTASKDSEEGLYETDPATTTFNVVVGPKRTNLTIETGRGTDNTIDIIDVTPYFNEIITNGTLLDIFKEPVVNAQIKILLNGEDYSQTTDSEGKFSLVYNATEGLTSYTLTVQFEGNDAYKPAGEVYTGKFTTEAFDITVAVDDNFPEEILNGDTVTVSGSATLQNQTLKNNPIVLTIDGVKYNTQTDEEGKFTYDYTVARTGNIPVIANATFANSNVKVSQKTITVAYPKVNVDLDEVSDTTVLSDVTLNGRVYITQNDTAIEDDLIFKINDETIPLSTDEEGYFTYTFTPDAIGIYEISIAYENNRYDVQNASATINVAKRATRLVNDKLPIAVRLTDTFAITGTLIDETNAPIVDAEVIFIINNERFTNTTDADGHYQYNYQTTTIGDNNLYEVRYSGDDKFVLAKNYVGSYFDVEAFKALITVDATDCGIGDTTTITGTVKKSKEDPLSNVEVLIKINDEEFTTTTNDEGIYEYVYTPSKIGDYNVTVTAVEFGQSSANTTFKVTKPITIITLNPIKTVLDEETTIIANVTTLDNSPVTGGKVAFKLNGKTIKDENSKVIYANVVDGKASIPYTFTLDNIQGNITAVYSGSTSYNGSRSEAIQAEIEQSQDEEPQLTGVATVYLEDIAATPGETITITATVKDGQVNIDEGKVVFKIAGKTVKDEKGKAIYVKVVDGKATLEYTIPTTYKVKDYTLKATYMSSIYDKTENESTLRVVKEKTVTGNSTQGLTNTNNALKADGSTVHVITNDNVDQYITANGLTDLVSSGDTLDIQGTIDRQHSLVFNKPVNVISSTQDAVINLHTVAGSLMGENPGNCFVVNKAGSYSNISNLYLNNTECWIFNTHDVTLYNMTMHVKDARVGSGVGQTAIRYCENITIDSCLVYTENNGGSTSMALTGTSNSVIKNTIIQGVQGSGQVGNILYLGNRYNTGDKPSDFTLGVDDNITVLNCTLMGECNAAITVMTFYGQVNHVSYINCTLNASGDYATIQARNGTASGNKFYQKGSIALLGTCEAYDNVFYDNGQMTTYAGTTAYNNTLHTLEYVATANVYNNTIKALKLYAGSELSNNIIDGDISFSSTSSNRISNVILSNNTMTGNVAITGASTIYRTSNLQLIDNDIAGNVSITYATNTKLINNTINGTVTIASVATGSQLLNNTIVTSNPYAVSNAATSTVITDNYLISNNYQRLGPDAITDSGRINKANNGPDSSDFWIVSIDPVYATVGDDTVIQVNVIDEITGVPIEDGEIYLMINDDILTDENGNIITATVSSSQALFEINAIPKEWLRSDAVLTAVYTKGEFIKANSTYMTILKREANVEITTEELTITPGQTVTLTAKVTDFENGEDISGQLAFKVDGISLDDDNGKLICVDVVDGIATLEYTFGDDITTGTYTLSAVFENPYYVRSTDDKTLVIE